MEDLRIKVVQHHIIWENKKKTLESLENKFLNQMAPESVDCIFFPEMFATGFTMKPSEFWENESGITFQWLKKWAKELKTCIGGGLITKEKDNYHNTFVLVRPDGGVEQYSKRHLFRMGEENQHYSPGKEQIIVDVKGWKLNLQICYDLRFPVFSRNKLIAKEPLYDVVVYIANWPEVRINAWTNLLQARAIENQAFVVGVNRVGQDGNGIGHSGETAVVDPYGNHILTPVINNEGSYPAILKRENINKLRRSFPVLLDADLFKLTD